MPERLTEIFQAPAFPCHKTVDYGAEELPEALVARFDQRYAIDADTGCWVWTASLDHYGYGAIGGSHKKRRYTWKAHRLSWLINCGGDLPPDMDVLHSCDNRACVNPDHLFLGDNTFNMLDAVEKGRRLPYRPITIAVVQAMREEYVFNSREHGTPALARKYGCSVGQAHNIVTYASRTEYKNDRPQQCVGLMAILHREDRANQIMQVAERFGELDPASLDPEREAYASIAEAMAAHDGKEPR